MNSVKVSLKDLEKALKFLQTNSADQSVRLSLEAGKVSLCVYDRLQNGIEIVLYAEELCISPKVSRTETLT